MSRPIILEVEIHIATYKSYTELEPSVNYNFSENDHGKKIKLKKTRSIQRTPSPLLP